MPHTARRAPAPLAARPSRRRAPPRCGGGSGARWRSRRRALLQLAYLPASWALPAAAAAAGARAAEQAEAEAEAEASEEAQALASLRQGRSVALDGTQVLVMATTAGAAAPAAPPCARRVLRCSAAATPGASGSKGAGAHPSMAAVALIGAGDLPRAMAYYDEVMTAPGEGDASLRVDYVKLSVARGEVELLPLPLPRPPLSMPQREAEDAAARAVGPVAAAPAAVVTASCGLGRTPYDVWQRAFGSSRSDSFHNAFGVRASLAGPLLAGSSSLDARTGAPAASAVGVYHVLGSVGASRGLAAGVDEAQWPFSEALRRGVLSRPLRVQAWRVDDQAGGDDAVECAA